ncbi:MAG TPA: serine hydrolase domain-containing protein [Acidimicrobiales bacterium]|nr:serine hydrolase domain-containing protein [Acidimicrobiales bacterium]
MLATGQAEHGQVREETARALQLRLAAAQSRSRVPSVVAGIARAGRLIWFGAATGMDVVAPPDQTQYRCGSISKTFVAVEVMRLRDEGLIELDARIGSYLNELDHLGCTVRQLLSHTSGLRAETAGPWWERTPGVPFETLVATSLREVDELHRPGRRFHYSNVGYAVLGELVRRVRGAPWDEVVTAELLEPAGMLRTTAHPVPPHAEGYGVHPHADVLLPEPAHDAGAMAPAGQLWTTVGDLARWSSVLAGERPEVLAQESAAEMREPVALNDLPGQPWTVAYGLGLELFNREGRRSYGHRGSMPGFLAALRVDELTGDGVVVMANATSGLEPSLESDLLSMLESLEPAPPEPWQPLPGGVAGNVLDLTGAWYWGTSGFILSATRDGHLDLHALGLGREATFRPAGEDLFVGLSGYYAGETLRVARDAGGRPSRLDLGSFVFTRLPYDPAAGTPGGVDARGWQGRAPSH